MSKKSHFRGLFGKQHGKRVETLLKCASQHFDHIYRFLPRKLSWEMSDPKHVWNLHHSTFTVFIGHWQGNCVRKFFSYLHAKSWHSLLTHKLLMTSILFLIETILPYQFRRNYLRKKNFFLNFLLYFWNPAYILNIFNKKMTLIDFVFSNLRTPKT